MLLLVEKDVRRLDVAVEDALRVQVREARGDLDAMQPFLAGSSGRLFLPCSSECSEPPCMNSSTIAGRPSCMTVPMNAQMCGWRSLRQISTSDMKHFKESLPMLGSSLSTFTATVATPQLASHTLLSLPSAQKRVSVRSANCFSCHSSLCVESHGQFNAVDSPCDCDVSPSEPTGVVIADLGGVSSVTGRVELFDDIPLEGLQCGHIAAWVVDVEVIRRTQEGINGDSIRGAEDERLGDINLKIAEDGANRA
eukprot:CAMPEP_0183357140 /NCGR_PEP_ID=MMETSP0164_2-20130417/45445_1 /TAXON_ID=221442 /ORGANISM="Coccolithus pelagicus ssp braarudi, Strain PLY182g" /LENGTH=251 /DNA_ID=CAMNT_0025530697 /DNA_START=782 /DNA_END=1537 /DNA_ORIENTATION=+